MNEETFVVDNDQKAEWAIKKIIEIRKESQRLINICKEEIEIYNSKANAYGQAQADEESYFINQLEQYFETVPHKQTKTLDKYELPSGQLVRKFKKATFEKCDNILEELQNINLTEFIKQTPSVKWAELKETLKEIDGKIISVNADGEIIEIPGVFISADSSKFEVKI